jgi:glutaconate CoA-transferase subunit A
MFGSDLLPARDWKTVKDPYTGEELLAIQSLRPEWTILHVEKADSEGNAFVSGSIFEDLLMANAASRVLVTAEEVVSTESFRRDGFRATFPGFLVETVVHAPRGAWPCSCGELYPVDEAYFKAYLEASGDEIAYRDFLRQHIFEEAKVAEEGSS